jgi:hypothetical protein
VIFVLGLWLALMGGYPVLTQQREHSEMGHMAFSLDILIHIIGVAILIHEWRTT